MPTITLEEHFTTRAFVNAIETSSAPVLAGVRAMREKMLDLDAGRLAAMEEGGIDMQVLSMSSFGFERLDTATASAILHDANDEVAAAVRRHPTRFAAFANLNLRDPADAARELERCVGSLGFCGAILNGHTGGAFLDDPRFLPIWEAADALQVPVYLHPAPPPQAVADVYYAGLPGETGQVLSLAAWGWHTELGLHVLRLILSGLFDRFPRQQVIIGHLGENLPYSLERASTRLSPSTGYLKRSISDCVHQNIHITTSGYFSPPSFLCALQVIGIDRLLYSVDYPFSDNTTGKAFLEQISLSPADFAKFTFENAKHLLKLRAA